MGTLSFGYNSGGWERAIAQNAPIAAIAVNTAAIGARDFEMSCRQGDRPPSMDGSLNREPSRGHRLGWGQAIRGFVKRGRLRDLTFQSPTGGLRCRVESSPHADPYPRFAGKRFAGTRFGGTRVSKCVGEGPAEPIWAWSCCGDISRAKIRRTGGKPSPTHLLTRVPPIDHHHGHTRSPPETPYRAFEILISLIPNYFEKTDPEKRTTHLYSITRRNRHA